MSVYKMFDRIRLLNLRVSNVKLSIKIFKKSKINKILNVIVNFCFAFVFVNSLKSNFHTIDVST